MSSLKRIAIAGAIFTNTMWAATACLPHNGRYGAGNGDGGGSVLASIGGINEKDKDRPFTYELVCGDVRVAGEAKADKDFVRFPGEKIKDGDECAMEVRISKDEAAQLEYEWYGRTNGVEDVGLFYGSDLQKVKSAKLALTLYSLAAPIVDNSFTVQANVKFELAEGEQIPAENTATANLVCGEELSKPGTFKKEAGENDATLVFTNLAVKELAGKTCTAVQVMVDNVVKFAADTPDLKLDGAKKNDVKIFPDANDATKRYTLKAVAAGGGDVDTTTTGGGACLNYENNVCKDVRTSADLVGDLPNGQNWILARVQGKAGDQGETKTFLVSAAKDGVMAILANKSFNVTDLNASLKADVKTFAFYQDASDAAFTGKSFDASFLASGLTAASADDLKDMKILHIQKIYVHGMHKVDEAALNAKAAPATWMAIVKATKDAIVSEFIVTGKTAGFTSDAVPLTVDGKPVYFDFPALATEMSQAAGSDKWKVYAYQSGAMSSAGCTLGKDDYASSLSLFVQDNLKDFGVSGGALAGCEVSQPKWDQALATGFDIKTEHFLWEWYVPTK